MNCPQILYTVVQQAFHERSLDSPREICELTLKYIAATFCADCQSLSNKGAMYILCNKVQCLFNEVHAAFA